MSSHLLGSGHAEKSVKHDERSGYIREDGSAATSGRPLHNPKLPGVLGIGIFKGHTFHPTQWDYMYNYTGGNTTGGFHKIGNKRIAIIGTGATPIPAIAHLAEGVGHRYVFQGSNGYHHQLITERTGPTDPMWVKKLTPGWQGGGWRTSTPLKPGAPGRGPGRRQLDRHFAEHVHPWAARSRRLRQRQTRTSCSWGFQQNEPDLRSYRQFRQRPGYS
ncbi:hypothetical protein GX51_00310 [Blastomyces parvus]|uniref:Uncharacterized protein n=1 Tax=Blastomyces parvus TaxID=2060905 RepID=A0A2B7XML0_9EURO|nr:hypothetical protein GX51_00310 [Blastomyces parvus]